ncbi:MAG TPA: hypothetical protein VMC10_23690 [Stellaceae bacterium]|nr:hypothetical protein [Stellaceae bacterium]
MWLLWLSCLAVGLTLAPPSARADFFDDARRTFTTDIPHFFQDDIPCAFGGKPTSGTKTSCKSPAKPATDKDRDTPGGSGKKTDPGNPSAGPNQ